MHHTAAIMNSLTSLSPAQLRRAARIQEKVQALQQKLSDLLGAETESAPRKRRLSAAGRAAIAAGARARWARAKGRGGKRRLSAQGLANIRAGVAKRMAARGKASAARPVRKRKFSAAGRARLSALAKARWAQARKSGRTTL